MLCVQAQRSHLYYTLRHYFRFADDLIPNTVTASSTRYSIAFDLQIICIFPLFQDLLQALSVASEHDCDKFEKANAIYSQLV